MNTDEQRDPLWQAAWTWIQREHERDGFDDAARMQLAAWLAADPAHRQTYAKARRLWLLVGLVPPANANDARDAIAADAPAPGHVGGVRKS